MNIAKAFDNVEHSIILGRLQTIGFPRYIVVWVEEYLSDPEYFFVLIADSGRPCFHMKEVFFKVMLCLSYFLHFIERYSFSLGHFCNSLC